MIFSAKRKLGSALTLFLVILLMGACSEKPVTEEEMMKAGLDALHTRNDPKEAAEQFRKVLERNPNHYGATFQLATALGRAGKSAEARPLWEKMLKLAEAINDKETAGRARAQLASPGNQSEEGMMKAGLDALYTRNEPKEAAEQFRKVLERNPNHYGATFQLATALDRTGKPTEARPLWEKMLKMAEATKDKETIATVRSRLSRKKP